MIRVIILFVFLFIVWVLYASGFEKPRKVRICVIALILCAIGLWFDGYDKREVSNLVNISDVESCGLTAKYSYRTNFDMTICVKNDADKGTLSRLDFAVVASYCEKQACTELQRVVRSVPVKIAPASQTTFEQNLSFDKISASQRDLHNNSGNKLLWSIEILDTKALR